jgi:hypothetical protein
MSDSHDDVRSMRTSAYTQEVREYPPGSKLLAELRSGSSSGISIRVICGGKVVSEADKNGLVSLCGRHSERLSTARILSIFYFVFSE